MEQVDRELIGLALDRICNSEVRSEMAQKLVMNYTDDGADSLAESIIN